MSKIILLETSTALTSVAVAEDGVVIAYKESEKPREQASSTAPFVKELLDGKGLSVKDCSAVCVSKGPGSYTGLRVGVSTAKGLCFGAGIPLLSVGTLDVLVWQAVAEGLVPEGCKYIVPMVDARRMEVYTAVFSVDGKQLEETEPRIIDADSFKSERSEGGVLFIGDGADKCKDVLSGDNSHFVQCCPKASAMAAPAFKSYNEKRFEDVAYFEPFYLKQFVPTVGKHKLF